MDPSGFVAAALGFVLTGLAFVMHELRRRTVRSTVRRAVAASAAPSDIENSGVG